MAKALFMMFLIEIELGIDVGAISLLPRFRRTASAVNKSFLIEVTPVKL